MNFQSHLITSKLAMLLIVVVLFTCGSVLAADTTPPTLVITSPMDGGTYATDEIIMIAAEACDAGGIDRVGLLIDGQDMGSILAPGPYEVSWDLRTTFIGAHAITVIAYDNAGNYTTRSIAIFVVNSNPADTTPPTLSITSPVDGAAYSTAEIITISADASDASGINRVELYIDGILKGADYVAPYTVPWDLANVALGSHTITGEAYDNAGNYTIKSVSIAVFDDSEPEHPGQKKGKN